ncbi:leucyl aminopeptidase [Verrucomicrobia bacterium LW23]|nr:leucyl aminopeptidase [Verrucomicrobia bacterium LW23]
MKLDVCSQVPASGDVVLFVFKGGEVPPGVTSHEFEGNRLSTLLWRENGKRTLYVGLGEDPRPDGKPLPLDLLRRAAGVGVKALRKLGVEEISLQATGFEAQLVGITEGALLADYVFEEFKPEASRRKTELKRLNIVVARDEVRAAEARVDEGKILARATNEVRAIGNLPGNIITPEALAERARNIARDTKITCRVWDMPKLQKEGFGGIIAVGKGSANPPVFIALEYMGGAKKDAPYVVVGKAITFDTGGISIKPAANMDEMKFDKMGGCAVLGIMRAAAELKLPINLVGLIASAENMPSAEAYRPGDIVTTYDGKTIEVLNTDAEGRIVLADALAYGRTTYKPKLMIDMATLTGAVLIALGHKRAGLFCNDEPLRKALQDAAESTGEPVWHLPMGDEFTDQIKSDVALAKNTGGREGGSATAASFLQMWAEDVRWAHLDIAGTAWTTKELPFLEKGATGYGVRIVLQALRTLAEAE